jgi:hypothetical protein
MSALQTLLARITLLLGVFMLLALPVVQSQTGNAAPRPAVKSPPAAPVVQKPPDASAPASQGNAAGGDASKDTSKDAASKTTLTARLENARLDAADSDYANISITDCVPAKPDPSKIVCDGRVFHLKVNDLALRAKVNHFHVGDHLRVDIDKGELQDVRGAWSVPSEGIGPTCRLMILAVCALAILGLAAAVTKGAPL